MRNLGIDMTDEEFKELMETLDEDHSNEIDCEAPSRRFDVFDVSTFSTPLLDVFDVSTFSFRQLCQLLLLPLSSCPFWRPNAWHSGRDLHCSLWPLAAGILVVIFGA